MVIGEAGKALYLEDRYVDSVSDPRAISRANRMVQLVMAGRIDEAIAAAPGVLDAAEAAENPYAIASTLLSYGFAFRDADPQKALDAMHRGMAIARKNGIRSTQAYLANNIGRLLAHFAASSNSALEYLTQAIRISQDSGSITAIRSPMAVLVGVLTGIGSHEQAAVIAGFADTPLTRAAFPKLDTDVMRLRQMLGDGAFRNECSSGRGDDDRRHCELRIRPDRSGTHPTRAIDVRDSECGFDARFWVIGRAGNPRLAQFGDWTT